MERADGIRESPLVEAGHLQQPELPTGGRRAELARLESGSGGGILGGVLRRHLRRARQDEEQRLHSRSAGCVGTMSRTAVSNSLRKVIRVSFSSGRCMMS